MNAILRGKLNDIDNVSEVLETDPTSGLSHLGDHRFDRAIPVRIAYAIGRQEADELLSLRHSILTRRYAVHRSRPIRRAGCAEQRLRMGPTNEASADEASADEASEAGRGRHRFGVDLTGGAREDSAAWPVSTNG
jgi:hypothetical protein